MHSTDFCETPKAGTMKNAALLDKINARLAILGRSASNVSRAATGDPSTIRRMQRASPTLDTLQAIADELGLSLSDLLSASAEASAPPQLLLPAPGAPAAVHRIIPYRDLFGA